MLEVTKLTVEGQDFLKIKLIKVDKHAINVVTSIQGWFKAQEPMCYGLPYSKLGEFINKTKDLMVLWKSNESGMGNLTKGIKTSDIPKDFIIPYRPKIDLRPHQVKAFNLLMERDVLLISDEEGTGKTFGVLCSIEAKINHGVANRCLYVTKASLVYDVKNQANKSTNLEVMTIEGDKKARNKKYNLLHTSDRHDVVVVSYETFRADLDSFVALHEDKPFDIMVIDEAHKAKSVTSGIGKAIHKIDASQKYAMTASPIINEIIDLYNVLKWLGLIQYNYWHFLNKFCDLDQWNKPYRYKNLSEIKATLQSNMLRRLKTEVLKDLPPVVSKDIYVEMTPTQRKLYKAVLESDDGIINGHELGYDDLMFEEVPSELAKYGRLAQVAESSEIVGAGEGKKASAKLTELDNLLDDIVARGEKAVVFSRSKTFTEIMYKFFSKYNPAIVTGDVDSMAKTNQDVSDRQIQVDMFQEDDSCKVIFCSDAAAREGLTLTRGNNIIFTSKPWAYAYLKQALGRVFRFGQQGGTTGSINMYSIIAKDTVDERIEKLLEDKKLISDSIVETPLGTKQILQIMEGDV